MKIDVPQGLDVCLWLAQAIGRIQNVADIYAAALEALERGLGVTRSSILLFDPDGVMRFKAWRNISADYRAAVEGHTPWSPETPDATPIVVPDVSTDPELAAYAPVFAREHIQALTFIPLVSSGRVIGKFMLYYDAPRTTSTEELQLAGIVAAQVAFAVERTITEITAQDNEERLRFALHAAHMGTWEWDVRGNRVRWSENLERIHGMSPGSFDGTLEGFMRDIHSSDRARVLESAMRAAHEGVPYETEYRIVTAAGELRWLEAKGRVEYLPDGKPWRMTGVCMDITRRKHAEIDRLQGAQEASRMKDEFLAVLSHELRTPLNAILGWAQLLSRGALDPGRAGEAINVIERNARLQAQLIEQILDVSRIITGKLRIETAPCALDQLVENAVHAMTPAAEARGLTIALTIDPELPSVIGDAPRLQQVLGNVLSNAVKFTPPGGAIAVRVARDGGSAVIEVQDTGAGIPVEFLPYVFERFRQADGTSTRQHGGLGLGLAIARHLIELHGGTIAASSDGPGTGTLIRISLPVAPHGRVGTLERPAAHEVRTLAGTRILIVDDEPDARMLLTAIFSGQGAVVSEASSAIEAMDRLADHGVDLLVADIGMPEVDGFELIERVRRTGREVRAIAVTAYARPEDRARALESGYDAFLAKPFDPAVLLRTASDLAVGSGLALRQRQPALPG